MLPWCTTKTLYQPSRPLTQIFFSNLLPIPHPFLHLTSSTRTHSQHTSSQTMFYHNIDVITNKIQLKQHNIHIALILGTSFKNRPNDEGGGIIALIHKDVLFTSTTRHTLEYMTSPKCYPYLSLA